MTLVRHALGIACAIIVSAFSGLAQAQNEEPRIEWEKKVDADQRLRSYGPDLMGDQIDPHTGSIVFEHADVEIPGNSNLQVALRRRLTQGLLYDENVNAEFGDWEYVVPRIVVIAPGTVWQTGRCTSSYTTTLPPVSAGKTRTLSAWEYSNGIVLEAPGQASQQMLQGKTGAHWPAAATWVTAEGWYFTCTTSSDGKGGFIGIAPNGDQYRFDRYIQLGYTPLGSLLSGKQANFGRKKHILAATQVTDVHGNWVNYDYDASGRLDRIIANDGREIDIVYSGASRLVSQVRANPNGAVRTWNYAYRASNHVLEWESRILNSQVLSTVTQPDGRSWTFNLDGMAQEPGADQCEGSPQELTVTHPYGMQATFGLVETRHRHGLRQMMQQAIECPSTEPGPPGGPPPPVWVLGQIDTLSVVSKTLSGPNVPAATWTFAYEYDTGPVNTGASTPYNWTIVTEPGGTQMRYEHYWVAGDGTLPAYHMPGKLFSREAKQSSGSAALETTSYSYLAEGVVGSTFTTVGKDTRGVTARILTDTVSIVRDGDTYATDNDYITNFSSATYSFGFPTTVTETSSTAPALQRTTSTAYAHDKSKWVLGLPSTVTRNGKQFDGFTYDAFGRVLTKSMFGSVDYTYVYHTSGVQAGLVHTATDADGEVYTLTNWKRGQVQNVARPGGSTIQRVIDDNGWVTSETDPNGNTRGFTYNTMGWLSGVDYPGAFFASMTVGYSGLGTGVQETRTRGDRRTVISYDGMLRPTLIKTEALNSSFSAFYEKMSYDIFGREIFKSWPSTSSNPTAGVNSTYDALSRPLTTQETVAPSATTTTAYLSSGRTRVTDPSGAVVTTWRRAFGRPDADPEVMQVEDALLAATTMTRDIYGNITVLSQSGTQNGFTAAVTRSFWYDNDLRLCRHRAPEFGDEVFAYGNEDELIGSGRGADPATTCPGALANIPSGIRVTRGYDVLDRETSVTFPAGTPNITRTLDNNGNVAAVLRGNVWTYAYNELDQLTEEKLLIDGRTYEFDYDYNATGNLLGRANAHSGAAWRFDPDALGRPQSARIGTTFYVGSVDYHPNGLIADANYLNGQTLTQTLNARQLPDALKTEKPGTATAVHLVYGYDSRRKISSITDFGHPGNNRSFTYDPNGRLLTASGAWGAGSFKYDALGNIREQQLGSRIVTVSYDPATNRASSFRDTALGDNALNILVYDLRGNMTDTGTSSLGRPDMTYDLANQPVSVFGSVVATYAYDGNLKRVKELRDGKTVYTIYSKLTGGLIYRDEVTDAKTTDYVTAGGASVRLRKVAGGAFDPEFTHFDAQGSTVAATNPAGTVRFREQYNPFGQERLDSASNDNNTAYTGHLTDDATGLIYMQARYYDPIIGRFLSVDPLSYLSQPNLYAYVSNDPINKWDPLGLVEREVSRRVQSDLGRATRLTRTATITVEAGNLTQQQTEDALDGVPDSFFSANNGQNLSSGAKPVVGGSQFERDTTGVQTQVAARFVRDTGDNDLAKAWGNITAFRITGLNHPTANAQNPRGRGEVFLHKGFFGRSGFFMIKTLIHEALHDTVRYQSYQSALESCNRGRGSSCDAAEEIHNTLDGDADAIIWGTYHQD